MRIALSVIFLTTSAALMPARAVTEGTSALPDLQTIYAVIDGMPMRGSEMSANPGRC